MGRLYGSGAGYVLWVVWDGGCWSAVRVLVGWGDEGGGVVWGGGGGGNVKEGRKEGRKGQKGGGASLLCLVSSFCGGYWGFWRLGSLVWFDLVVRSV